MKIKVHQYGGCGTCRKALQFLKASGIEFNAIPIRESPPSPGELKRMLKYQGGNLRKLFNTSGLDYKRLKLKDSLPTMSESEAIQLLAANGNLVKRPFVLLKHGGLVGFDESEWGKALVKQKSVATTLPPL